MSYMEQAAAEQGVDITYLKAVVAPLFWGWFMKHKGDRIKLSLWIFRPSAKIEKLEPFFVQLFGPNPF